MKKYKDIIIGISISIAILGGLIWLARPQAPAVSNFAALAPENLSAVGLEAEYNSYDFGAISMAAGNVNHGFKIKNADVKPNQITKIYTSCMCTTAYLLIKDKRFGPFGMPGHGFVPPVNKIIDAGEEATIEVIFDPAAHGPAGIGPIQRTVYVEQENQNVLQLEIAANVKP